jgi:hypothetical protein
MEFHDVSLGIHYDQAVALGLKKQIVKLEAPDIRRHPRFCLEVDHGPFAS